MNKFTDRRNSESPEACENLKFSSDLQNTHSGIWIPLTMYGSDRYEDYIQSSMRFAEAFKILERERERFDTAEYLKNSNLHLRSHQHVQLIVTAKSSIGSRTAGV